MTEWPHDNEAEQAVLGSVLIDPKAADKVLDRLTGADFYRPAHQHIFRAMADLFERGEAVDLVTVRGLLKARDQLDQVGGSAYLTQLAEAVFSAANVGNYIKPVRETAFRRRLLQAADRLAAEAKSHPGPIEDLIALAEAEVQEVADRQVGGDQGLTRLSAILHPTIREIEKRSQAKGRMIGLPTGFLDLDDLICGWQASDLIVIAGRPSMGKTALAVNAVEAAAKGKHPAVIFSLEQSNEQLAMRMLAAESGVDSQRLRTGRITGDSEWRHILDRGQRLYDLPLFLDESPRISVSQIRAKARRLKRKHGLELIVIDYLQLVRGRPGIENRVREIGDITKGLKALAKELNVPVIVLSQLSRKVEDRVDKCPLISDLRDSGEIEEDADAILLLYRDAYYNPGSPYGDTAEVNVAKARNGPTGRVWLRWNKELTRFEDLDQMDLKRIKELKTRKGRRAA